MKRVLVTGGAGYIGTHTCIELIQNGYEIIVADNFSNSCMEAINRTRDLAKVNFEFANCDLCDMAQLKKVFEIKHIDAVIHFAGLKAVGESVALPLKYYNNNLISTLNLLECMNQYGTNTIVFSSSATVYGSPKTVPIDESFDLSVTNPYGATKLMIEDILRDIAKVNANMHIALLRYFNPIGAHESAKIGEDPNGIPNNLLPYITQVAIGKLKELSVFGNDYDTVDGTGVRDYIHVVDLAKGHVAVLKKLEKDSGLFTYNLGTGRGYSVLQLVAAFEKVSLKKIPYKIVGRRAGDIASCYANPQKIKDELGWSAKYGIEDMCLHSWNWQHNNPNGYRSL